MKNTSFLVGPLLLALFVGCNDVSPNRKTGTGNTPNVMTPSLEGGAIEGVRSQIIRERGAVILSYTDEISKTLDNSLGDVLYRTIPLMEKDDEGSSKNVITLGTNRPATDCGSGNDAFTGINARIADCLAKNPQTSLWNGTLYGASGEGSWKLVSKTTEQELWLDVTTGMVWSGLMKHPTTSVTAFNWCKASGNSQNDTTSETIDCLGLGATESICHNADTGTGTQIKWRLPTRNDFLQADLDGMRFVLKKESTLGTWTATLRAAAVGRSEAWVYSSLEGTLIPGTLSTERQVRCIGVPLR
jgi:hypothetical protein